MGLAIHRSIPLPSWTCDRLPDARQRHQVQVGRERAFQRRRQAPGQGELDCR